MPYAAATPPTPTHLQLDPSLIAEIVEQIYVDLTGSMRNLCPDTQLSKIFN